MRIALLMAAVTLLGIPHKSVAGWSEPVCADLREVPAVAGAGPARLRVVPTDTAVSTCDLRISTGFHGGVPAARLFDAADSMVLLIDNNPFAQRAGRTRPLLWPARVGRGWADAPAPALSALLAVSFSAASTGSTPPAEQPVAGSVGLPESDPPPESSAEPDSVEKDSVAEGDPPPAMDTVVQTMDTSGQADTLRTFVVVIDAGHGGRDPGASGKDARGRLHKEKTIALQVARRARDLLDAHPRIRVVMTRDDDIYLPLERRTRRANEVQGDLFLSIHGNAIAGSARRRAEVRGFRVFLLREGQSEGDRAIARREKALIAMEEGSHTRKEQLTPLEWLALEHQINLYSHQSERLAEHLVREMTSGTPLRRELTGAGQAGFFVLVGALMPSALLEIGYVSNPAEVGLLADPAVQRRIARSIDRAVRAFLGLR